MNTDAKSNAEEPRLPKWKLISLYVCICMGLFLSFLDTSIVATAIFVIGSEFEALSQVNWVALSYTLAYLGCTAIFASLSDVFGRRNIYICVFVIFLAASLGCGWAQNVDQLIVLRALQGIGGSGLYSVGFVILPEISPVRMLKMIGALAGIVLAMSGVLGPLLGGIITQYTTWRWIFWINGPIGIGPLVLFAIAWPTDKELVPRERRSISQLDFVGFLLLIGASVPFVFAFQEAGIRVVMSTNAWSAAVFVAPLVVGIVCWIALFGWEYLIHIRWSNSIGALFPLRMARSKAYMSAVTSTVLMGFPYLVIIYILPIRFQIVNGRSALASGIALLPMLGSVAVGSAIAGPIAMKVRNSVFFIMFTGAAMMLIGTATLSTLTPESHDESKAYGLQVLVGLGFGLTISISSMIASVENEPRDSAAAQGIMAQVRMFGGSIGIAVSTVILGTMQRQQLLDTGIINPFQLASLHEVMSHLSDKEVLAIRKAYSDSFNKTLVVCSIISGIALLLSVGFWEKKGSGTKDKLKQRAARNAVGEAERGSVERKNPVISDA
ncbi:MFS multidrug transporter-like protein [Periconia macrospinosa]|uniref:MFS multidrug transporter-like protein n=1 Tax=Periconia macrospinosa TaxID=97972 RepID=A0A2V1E7Q3_9PLEO|nr:MFS multidrug transporter-like protein [Periconia macrospinosa]